MRLLVGRIVVNRDFGDAYLGLCYSRPEGSTLRQIILPEYLVPELSPARSPRLHLPVQAGWLIDFAEQFQTRWV